MKQFIDLCAGTGAFSIALEKTGTYTCVYANDILESSKEVYTLNHMGVSVFKQGDIMDVDVTHIPKHDLLCCGFPCQPFSIAGDKKGFDDTRSNVFWKIIEILKYHQPESILLENVKNLVSHDAGTTFKVIKTALEACGYTIHSKILDTAKISNVPQHRERIYIVGFRGGGSIDLNFEPVKNDTLDHFIDSDRVPEKYYYTDKFKVYDAIKNGVVKPDTIYQYRRYYVRENKSHCCPTLTANMGSGGHNVPLIKDAYGIRKLTPRECFNLQGFPKNYILPTDVSDTTLYKLAGNAVSVPVVSLVVERLQSSLGS
jgi:DNA (cytosine-5)-methyltransferase 1